MKPNTALKAVSAAIALTGGMQAAQATPITVTQTLSLGALLNGGQSVSGLFDISALAVGAGITGDYAINSAQVVGYGYSDIVASTSYQGTNQDYISYYDRSYTQYVQQYYYYPVYYSYTYYYSYSCGWNGWSTCYGAYTYYGAYYQQGYYYYSYYVQAIDRNIYQTAEYQVTDPGATMQMTVASDVQSASSPYSSNSQSYSSYQYAGGGYYNGYGGYDYYYNREHDTYSYAWGPLTTTSVVGAGDLANSEASGQLAWILGSNGGDLNAVSIMLTAELEAVPEPGTLAVFGLGLLALLATRRRKVPVA